MIDDQPWFVAADVCEALDISNTARAMSRLDDDEKGIHSVNTLGGTQNVSILNESGLYSLILTSRKAEAKRFKKWVTAGSHSPGRPTRVQLATFSLGKENPAMTLP